ncbi:MAG TPA: ABC transporter permease [Bryobacteraceae bacterium]
MLFLQDLRFAWRQLRRSPGFLVVAVASLTFGIGANTAIFSLLNACLIRNLPIRDPQHLVILTDPASRSFIIGSESGARHLLSYPEFQRLDGEDSPFAALCAVESAAPHWQIRLDGGEEEIHGKLVSGSYFAVLGVEPRMGRFFDRSADSPVGSAPYAVLSDEYWARRFGSDPGVIGKRMVVRNTALTIIGVAPRGFFGESVGQRPDVWAPLSMQPQLNPGRDWLARPPDPTENVMWLHAFARLKPGISLGQAAARANLTFQQMLKESYASVSEANRRQFLDQHLALQWAPNGASELRSRFADALYVLFAAVGVTLLICCANLTNLLLARANGRSREMAVRRALGAGRLHIVRQLFTESLLLSVLGALCGLALAKLIGPLLVRMASGAGETLGLVPALDWHVLVFTGVVAILTTALVGLAPSLRAGRANINATLRDGTRSSTASAGRLRWDKFFVAAQVALSLVLLVTAGLFLRTLLNLQHADLGYAREKLLLLRVDGVMAGYKEQRLETAYRQLLDAFRNTPGVRGATYSQNGLFTGNESGDTVRVEGYTPRGTDDRAARFDTIGPGYFSALGIPLLLGREIDTRDRPGSLPVCVVNESFAHLFFAGRNPLGKHITEQYGDKSTTFEVVGVARNSRDHDLRGTTPPRIYTAAAQPVPGEPPSAVHFEIRTAIEPHSLLNTLRRAARAQNPNTPVLSAFTLDELIQQRVGQDRLLADLVSIFGVLALVLAAIGIYGIVAYGVSQRTGEIGVRMALGAAPAKVVAWIVRESLVVTAAGIVAGAALSYAATRLVASRLSGLTLLDVWIPGAAILVMMAIAALAASVPAWRAARIDPATALRSN